MKRPCRPILAALLLALAAHAARADESLAPEVARRLKEATVYVKVAIGPLNMTGSGFVIQAAGDSALIVTNQHVIAKPKVLSPFGFVPGLRGRDRMALMQLQRLLAANEPAVSVVFHSGEPDEQVVKAEVLCQLEDPDLAVLKVASPKGTPRPLEFRRSAQPSETMPVFILGFPFGDSLSASKANPSITIGRGSVSSLRKDRSGKVVTVQIDGALNPGNSGGPVVDARGDLVGVAVQTIQGSNIGLTIPAAAVASMLEGGLGKPTVTTTGSVNGAPPKYYLTVPVIDPLKRLKSASVRFVPKSVSADASKSGRPQLGPNATSRDLDLASKGGLARVELPIDPKAPQPVRQVTVQASFVGGDGQAVHLDPQVVAVPAPARVTTTDAQGTTTTTIVQEADGRTTRRQTTVTRGSSSGNAPATPNGGKPGAFQLGDRVIVRWAGKDEAAEVVGFSATGWVKVKFPRDGITLTPTLPPEQIKPAEKPKKAAPGAVLRAWTSKGNRFTIQARFVELKGGSVVLEKEGGETMTVPLDRLSDADQKQARQLADESEENPFASPARK